MIRRPPDTSRASRAFVGLLDAAALIRPRDAGLIVGAALALVLTLDWTTGSTVSLGFVYTLLICFAAWTLGERRGLGVAVVTVFGLTTVHEMQTGGDAAFATLASAWNAFSRLLSTALLVIVVRALRDALELERWRAATDGLTGVLNKGAFQAGMTTTIGRARARDRWLVLLYMDLDGFKGVNDHYGHAAGDRVLRTFATAAAEAIRRDDLFARIGGDEFVALLTAPSRDDGTTLSEALHARLTAILGDTGLPVTCSMGAVVIDAAHAGNGEGFIDLADALMYEVKRHGRDGLRVAHVDAPLAGSVAVPRRRPFLPMRKAA